MLEPIGKLCSYWPEVNTVISKRHKKVRSLLSLLSLLSLRFVFYINSNELIRIYVYLQLLDYDAARSKARKLTDKPSDDSTKLPRVSFSSRFSNSTFRLLDKS